MTNKDVKLLYDAFASVEKLIEDTPDEKGFSASTLRIAVNQVGSAIKAQHPRFNMAAFQVNCMPLEAARWKEYILAAAERSKLVPKEDR